MGTVGTNNQGSATAYGNERKIDRCQNGVLWCIQQPVTASTGAFYTSYSTDGGNTWTSAGTVNNASASAAGSTQPTCALFIDLDDYAHVVFIDSGNRNLYYTRGTPNTARTAYTWSAPTALDTGNSAYVDYPDLVAHRDPANAGAWVVHVAYSYLSSTTNYTLYQRIAVASSGAITLSSTAASGGARIGGSYGKNAWTQPSIDFRHTGDAKTAATVSGAVQPDLFVAWTAGGTGTGLGVRWVKATYASGSWTFGTEREIDNARYAPGTAYGINSLFDGTRAVITGYLFNGTNYDLGIYDRDAADTTTTARLVLTAQTSSSGTSYFQEMCSTYDSQGNIYLIAVTNTGGSQGTGLVFYRVWTRSTNALGAAVTVDSTANFSAYPSWRRGNAGTAADYVYLDGAASPYTVLSGRVGLNNPPTAPTLGAPADNGTADSTAAITVTFQHNDPDGDPASAYDVLYRVAGTSVPYTTINGTSTVANGGTITVTIPAGTWVGQIQWTARTYDASGTVGPTATPRTLVATPAATAALTGGQGGTSVDAVKLYDLVQAERALRALSLV